MRTPVMMATLSHFRRIVMPNPAPQMIARPIEILSLTAGEMLGDDVVLVTVRPRPETSAGSKLYAISREQAQRAYEDLGTILADDNVTWHGGE